MRPKPARKLEDYLRIRKVYSTQWPDVFEVINSAGDGRYRLFRVSPSHALCPCHAGTHEQACRHLLLFALRRYIDVGGIPDQHPFQRSA